MLLEYQTRPSHGKYPRCHRDDSNEYGHVLHRLEHQQWFLGCDPLAVDFYPFVSPRNPEQIENLSHVREIAHSRLGSILIPTINAFWILTTRHLDTSRCPFKLQALKRPRRSKF